MLWGIAQLSLPPIQILLERHHLRNTLSRPKKAFVNYAACNSMAGHLTVDQGIERRPTRSLVENFEPSAVLVSFFPIASESVEAVITLVLSLLKYSPCR